MLKLVHGKVEYIKTLDFEEASNRNLLNMMTRGEIVDNLETIGIKDLKIKLKANGCSKNILSQIEEKISEKDELLVKEFVEENSGTLFIHITCLNRNTKILLERKIYYSINIDTGEKLKCNGFSIVGDNGFNK